MCMKNILSLIFLCLACACSTPSHNDPTVHLIFDTDMAPDYDDVGALAILHALADSGEVSILATVSSNACETTVPCIDVINTYFGRTDIPMGVVKGDSVPNRTTWHQGLRWPELLPQHFPHHIQKSSDAEDALKVYRRILSAQPDHAVTIVTVGFFSNVQNLLLSEGDEYSPLSGKELVKQKVKQLVSMAGAYPSGREFNVYVDTKAAQFVISEWPTPILFSGFEIGSAILTGKRLVESDIYNSPIVETFRMCLPQDNPEGRESWDETAVLAAVRGTADYFDVVRGKMTVLDDGSNTWTDDEQGPHAYLVFKMPKEQLTAEIEHLMMHQPQAK